MPAPANRPRCPFYGFHWPEKSQCLNDSGANECALDFETNGPCIMEAQGREPDFDGCSVPVPIRALLEASKKTILLYPAEVGPEGVCLDEWVRKLMAHKRRAC